MAAPRNILVELKIYSLTNSARIECVCVGTFCQNSPVVAAESSRAQEITSIIGRFMVVDKMRTGMYLQSHGRRSALFIDQQFDQCFPKLHKLWYFMWCPEQALLWTPHKLIYVLIY
jgi:hypothetical protein